jgi:hypothetical protein
LISSCSFLVSGDFFLHIQQSEVLDSLLLDFSHLSYSSSCKHISGDYFSSIFSAVKFNVFFEVRGLSSLFLLSLAVISFFNTKFLLSPAVFLSIRTYFCMAESGEEDDSLSSS